MADDHTAIQQLESRLQRGWELIDEAQRSSDERAASRYTQHWLQLLAEYEDRLEQTGHPRPDEPAT